MRLPHRILLASILISALLTAGCGEIVSSLNDLGIVQRELTKKFGEEITINANHGPNGLMLMVFFVNSKLNDQTPAERQTRADQTAQIVKASYARMQTVSELWVGFIRKKTRLVVFHHTQVVGMHGFDKNGQPLPHDDPRIAQPPAPDAQVSTGYDERSDLTDISVSGIQLEGQPGKFGLTVLPYFKVKGDARGVKRGLPPKVVQLNFASYAEKPKFPQTVLISFVADGKVVHKTEGMFTGTDAQFCYLDVPYPAFRRIVEGKELIIKLGDKEYPLTPSQLGAMQKMTEYVAK